MGTLAVTKRDQLKAGELAQVSGQDDNIHSTRATGQWRGDMNIGSTGR